jgi:glycosyltransferase involved in cell wall biosynthesis
MRVLCVNYVISEFGGVEFAAMNLASGLVNRGHDVHFLAAAGQATPLDPDRDSAASPPQRYQWPIHCHYRKFPRIYPIGEKRGLLQKLIWHVQDLAHPKNETLFAEVLGQVKPDIIILHNITAIGSNIWRTVAESGIPCVQVIHDLALICLNMARFRSGRQCSGLCLACRMQKQFRFTMIAGAANFAFVSPSLATLQAIASYADLSKWRTRVIPNPNSFLVKQRRQASSPPRLLYVGRLEPSKGVDMMLRAARVARRHHEFELDILGTGVLDAPLRQLYRQCPWVKFHGTVDQNGVAEFMSNASVLLVPSQWLETVPGVAVHALFAGLPVLGSRIGGIPEQVRDGKTGRLLPPSDEAAWSTAIVDIVGDPEQVAAWSEACLHAAQRFDPASALDKYEMLMEEMLATAK